MPNDFLLGILPGSNTGAFEIALWNSLGVKDIDPLFCSLEKNKQEKRMENFISYLEENNVAFDIKSYRTAPLGLRIWCGPTVEKSDLENLTKWLQYGWESIYRK